MSTLRCFAVLLTALVCLWALSAPVQASDLVQDCASDSSICWAEHTRSSTWTPASATTPQPSGFSVVWLGSNASAPSSWTVGNCLPALLMGSIYDLYFQYSNASPAFQLWSVPQSIRYGFQNADGQWVLGTASYYSPEWITWLFYFDPDDIAAAPPTVGQLCYALK